MPNNTLEKWDEKTLGELCDVLDSRRKPITKKDRVAGVYPYYGATGILDYVSGWIFDEELVLLGEDGAKWTSGEQSAFKINGKTWVNNHAHVLRPKRDRISDTYLIYNLNFQNLMPYITGTTVPKLNQEKMRSITIPLPPLPEQERIVAKLDKAFEAIDKVKANAEQNLNNAKELFNDAQTTIFNEPFEEKKLGDICTLYQGLAINMKTKHLLCDKSTLPLLRIKDLKENCETQYVVEEGFPKNALVNESDIIYTRTGSLGLVFRGRKGVLHNNSFKVVPQKNISNDYLFEWLQNPIFNKKIVSLAQRAAQPDITHTLFKQQIINVPPFEIQLKKVKQINVIREYINTLNQIYTQKIKECDELKQSILQKAFRGEL